MFASWFPSERELCAAGAYGQKNFCVSSGLTFDNTPNRPGAVWEGDIPLIGDWDGNGTITVGVYRPSETTFYLRNTNVAGSPDIIVRFGSPDSQPVVGDWDGDGKATIGTFDRSRAIFSLLNTNAADGKPLVVPFGEAGDWPVTGDWNGDGRTKTGVFRNNGVWIIDVNGDGVINYSNLGVDKVFQYTATPGDKPLVGRW